LPRIGDQQFTPSPAIRGWLEGKANHFPPVPIGAAIRGPTAGRIISSNVPAFHAGELVFGLLTMQGFLLFAYDSPEAAARAQLAQWVRAGELAVLEDIARGLAHTPNAFCKLMTGNTCGKALVEVDTEDV